MRGRPADPWMKQFMPDPMTDELPGVDYRYLEDLKEDEVDDFTRDMHHLDVGEAVRVAPPPPPPSPPPHGLASRKAPHIMLPQEETSPEDLPRTQ